MKWPWQQTTFNVIAGDYHSEVMVKGTHDCAHWWQEELHWRRPTAQRAGGYRCLDCGETVRWWTDWDKVEER